jgi:deoxycytidine triphosphate deaminase
MLLNRQEIEDRCKAEQILTPFDPASLRNASYQIHADRAFSPESGIELLLGGNQPGFWTIAPAQALVIKTLEHVRMPPNLMGMYTQLNRWATKGLSLMNASLIEPRYEGPLSCQLVNFSRLPISIERGAVISKMTFHSLRDLPLSQTTAQIVQDADYDTGLSISAAAQPASFLDIANMEQRTRNQVRSMVWEALGIPAAVLGGLILIAAVEPWAMNFVTTHNGMSIDSSTKEVAALHEELKDMQDFTKLQADQAALRASVDTLTRSVNQLQKSKKP